MKKHSKLLVLVLSIALVICAFAVVANADNGGVAEVNGTEYKVAGPRFAGVTVKTLESGDSQILRSSNITAEGELPLVVHAKGDLSAAQAAMEERYPTGCTVPVFYDPRNPKKSFVERDAPISKRFTVIMLCICGLLALTGLVLAFIGICALRK